MEYHQPVLLDQVIKYFHPTPGSKFIDATLGNAGHTIELLRAGAFIYGIDQDPTNLNQASQRIKDLGLDKNFVPINSNFNSLSEIISTYTTPPIDGVLFDLGLSSTQLMSDNRGFSFNDQNSLDMRLDSTTQDLTAEYIINTYDSNELFDIFSKIGQEKFSRQIADYIIWQRQRHPIKNASTLAEIIKDFYQQKGIRSGIHPATKILMALRIVVNQEYDNLKNALIACLNLPSATIQVITFHSGEDRLVKQFIVNNSNLLTSLTPKPIKPTYLETKENRLSRSSLLRVFKIK